jgi:hypothetical protein
LTRAATRPLAVRYAAIAIAAAAATLVNPYGWQVWRYAIDLSSNDVLRRSLTEWAPTTIQGLTGKVFFAYVAAGVGLLAWRRPRLPLAWALLTAGLTVFALTAVRNIPWFALVTFPVWAVFLTRSFAGFRDSVTRPRTLRLMVLVMVAAIAIPIGKAIPEQLHMLPSSEVADQEQTLGDLVSYLQDHPDGALFNDANWGAYLEAHLPGQQVFIDTRFEVHTVPVWDDYRAVVAGRFDWESILDKYGIQSIAVDPDHSQDLVRALEGSGTWTETWHTDRGGSQAVVWTRTSSTNGQV